MSTQEQAPPSYAMPYAILVALAVETAFVLVRFALPASWFSEKYFLVSTGIYAASALLEGSTDGCRNYSEGLVIRRR